MIAWDAGMKAKAKDEKKALVKLQVQMKYASGGNFEMSGPFDPDHAMMLYLFATFRGEEKDHVVKAVGEVLAARKQKDG